MSHTIISKNKVFHGRAFDVVDMKVALPDGRVRNYDLVDHKNSVTIIPVDEDGMVWFVEQYRMGSECSLLELPAGVMNENERPEECAAREIREEIGMSAGKLRLIGSVFLAPGYANELNFIFLAADLTLDPLQQDDDEFITTHKLSSSKLADLIQKGELIDSKSLAALYLYDHIE